MHLTHDKTVQNKEPLTALWMLQEIKAGPGRLVGPSYRYNMTYMGTTVY